MTKVRLPCGCTVHEDAFHDWAGRNREALMRALSQRRGPRNHFEGAQIERVKDEDGCEKVVMRMPERE